jgi:hypothetical protein
MRLLGEKSIIRSRQDGGIRVFTALHGARGASDPQSASPSYPAQAIWPLFSAHSSRAIQSAVGTEMFSFSLKKVVVPPRPATYRVIERPTNAVCSKEWECNRVPKTLDRGFGDFGDVAWRRVQERLPSRPMRYGVVRPAVRL